jgi:hypothetical protein
LFRVGARAAQPLDCELWRLGKATLISLAAVIILLLPGGN